MIAGLHNVPVPEHQDQICIAYGGEPVGDDKAGPVFRQRVHGLLDHDFRAGIH